MENVKNLKVGLETLRDMTQNLETKSLAHLLQIYGRLEVLTFKCVSGGYDVNKIIYSVQDLQIKIHEELSNRIYK